jgi:hypothetical protein
VFSTFSQPVVGQQDPEPRHCGLKILIHSRKVCGANPHLFTAVGHFAGGVVDAGGLSGDVAGGLRGPRNTSIGLLNAPGRFADASSNISAAADCSSMAAAIEETRSLTS